VMRPTVLQFDTSEMEASVSDNILEDDFLMIYQSLSKYFAFGYSSEVTSVISNERVIFIRFMFYYTKQKGNSCIIAHAHGNFRLQTNVYSTFWSH